jgi:hypothetical protein
LQGRQAGGHRFGDRISVDLLMQARTLCLDGARTLCLDEEYRGALAIFAQKHIRDETAGRINGNDEASTLRQP